MALTRTLTGWFSAAVAGVLVLYPILVYVGIGRFGPSAIAVLLIAMCLLRLLVLWVRGDSSFAGRQTALITAGGILLAAASLLLGRADAMLYYPVFVNASLLFSVLLEPGQSAVSHRAYRAPA